MYIIIRLVDLCSLFCCFRVAAYDFINEKKIALYILFSIYLPYSPLRAIYIGREYFSECLSCRAGFLDVSCYGRDISPPYVNHFIIKSIYIYEKTQPVWGHSLCFFHIQIPICCLFLDVYTVLSYICCPVT